MSDFHWSATPRSGVPEIEKLSGVKVAVGAVENNDVELNVMENLFAKLSVATEESTLVILKWPRKEEVNYLPSGLT